MDESVELDSEVQISIASREWFTQCLPNVTVEKKNLVFISLLNYEIATTNFSQFG